MTDINGESEKYISNLLIEKDSDRLYSFEISNTEMEYQESDKGNSSEVEIIKRKSHNDNSNTREVEKPSRQMKLAR